jgi:translocation and assembly module TamB
VKQGVNAQMIMNRLRPFARPDREVVLSGTTQLGFDGVRLFTITGNVSVDKALIDMPPFPPPSLDNDVHLAKPVSAGNNQAQAYVAYVTQVDLNLDLGNNFRFKGQGADVYMTGNVRLNSESDNPEIRANGTVRITRGTYLFYGQTLTVQRGLVTFAGPMDDPSINILASRNISTTEVGVEVSGTLADTRARLQSTPDMPDEEKLAWLLFGRSMTSVRLREQRVCCSVPIKDVKLPSVLASTASMWARLVTKQMALRGLMWGWANNSQIVLVLPMNRGLIR